MDATPRKIKVIPAPLWANWDYMIVLIGPVGETHEQGRYKTPAGALRKIERLQGDGHTIEDREFDKIAME